MELNKCKHCGDITCSGQCNWLKPLVWSAMMIGVFGLLYSLKKIIFE